MTSTDYQWPAAKLTALRSWIRVCDNIQLTMHWSLSMIDSATFEETSMSVFFNLTNGDGKKWNLLNKYQSTWMHCQRYSRNTILLVPLHSDSYTRTLRPACVYSEDNRRYLRTGPPDIAPGENDFFGASTWSKTKSPIWSLVKPLDLFLLSVLTFQEFT